MAALKGAVESKPERLKVGDYAKVVKNVRGHEVEVGTILLVTAIDNEAPFIKCDEHSGNRIGWFYEDEIVRATDEEVAEAKRAVAEHKKWAEIGREVGEYKVGDVVQLSDHNRKLGVMDYIGVHFYGVELSTGDYVRPDKDRVTLVTPVEARFDR